jgi:hypothetical protein
LVEDGAVGGGDHSSRRFERFVDAVRGRGLEAKDLRVFGSHVDVIRVRKTAFGVPSSFCFRISEN